MNLNDIKGIDFNGKKLESFNGRVLFLGFGGVGQTMLPMFLRHIAVDPRKVTVLEKDNHLELFQSKYAGSGIKYVIKEITKDNIDAILSQYVNAGSLIINLSLNIDGIEIVTWCLSHNVLYTDTSIERWPDEPDETIPDMANRTLYVTHAKIRAATAKWKNRGATALVTNGANPGLVSQFTKAALLDIAKASNLEIDIPRSREEWANLMMRTGTKVVHIAERDTQIIDVPKVKGEFVGTWSCEGLQAEGRAPSEIGFGTHENPNTKNLFLHRDGPGNAAYLNSPGVATLAKSWVPSGPYNGFVIQHSESVTMSEYFTAFNRIGLPVYRPSIYYVYCPCDSTIASIHEFRGKELSMKDKKRVLKTELIGGLDELGVLLLGHRMNGWWYGSRMSVDEATTCFPGEGPTTIQVAANLLAGIVWMIQNPKRGFVEPEELPFEFILNIARPYLGTMASVQTNWTPLADRSSLFRVDTDPRHPWRFENFSVIE
jgi:homospermidine synthase